MLGGPRTPLLPTPSKAKEQPRGEDGRLRARRSAAMCFPLRHYYFQPGEAATAGGATAPCPPQCFGGGEGVQDSTRASGGAPLLVGSPSTTPAEPPAPRYLLGVPLQHRASSHKAWGGTCSHQGHEKPPWGVHFGVWGVTRYYLHMWGSRQYSHEGRTLSRMIMGGRTLRGLFWACNPRRRPPPKKTHWGGWGERSRLSPSNSGTRRPPQILPARGCAGAVR